MVALKFLKSRDHMCLLAAVVCAWFYADLSGPRLLVTGQLLSYNFAHYGVLNVSLELHGISNMIVYLYDLKGISVTLRQQVFVLVDPITHLVFQNFLLDLYDERGVLIKADRCSAEYFEGREIQYFSSLIGTRISLEMRAMNLKRPICPYLFKNAKIFTLALMNYGNKALYRNVLSFYEIRNPRNLSIDLNVEIETLSLMDIYKERLDARSMDSVVFSTVVNLELDGTLAHIEEGFLKNFKQLFTLQLNILNTGSFFQSSNNEWLATLFNQGRYYHNKKEMGEFLAALGTRRNVFTLAVFAQARSDNYTFPDEDFCLFKHFPRQKAVATFLHVYMTPPATFSNSKNASCTYRFLSFNNVVVRDFINSIKYPQASGATFDDSYFDECDFDRRLSFCFNDSSTAGPSHVPGQIFGYETSEQEVIYVLGWMEYIGPIITFPIFSALAFALNMLVILVIRSRKNKAEKLFEAKSFRLMEMNSAFNCVECLIYQLRLLGICLGLNAVYCSTVRNATFVSYLGVVNYYLSEVMKSCSMMTGLLFSIQRFAEATKKTEGKYLGKLCHTRIRTLVFWVLVYGLVSSIPVFFNVSFTNLYLNAYDTPTIFYLGFESLSPAQKPQAYLYFAHYIMNDLVILVINLVVDCCLVHHVKADLRHKLFGRIKLESENLACDKKQTFYDRKMSSCERKANTMIILSVVIYILCRLPELAGIFFLFFYKLVFVQSSTCYLSIICYLIYNFIEYMYMLSYFFNIFLYLKFNTNFRKGFRYFFHNIIISAPLDK